MVSLILIVVFSKADIFLYIYIYFFSLKKISLQHFGDIILQQKFIETHVVCAYKGR